MGHHLDQDVFLWNQGYPEMAFQIKNCGYTYIYIYIDWFVYLLIYFFNRLFLHSHMTGWQRCSGAGTPRNPFGKMMRRRPKYGDSRWFKKILDSGVVWIGFEITWYIHGIYMIYMDPFWPIPGTAQVERGNHEALLNAGQNYSSMWKRQAAGIMEDPGSPREEEMWSMSKGWRSEKCLLFVGGFLFVMGTPPVIILIFVGWEFPL